MPDGEQAKTASPRPDCWEALGEAGFTRSDAVVTVGGGATTDLGGFVAATWLRGVRVVHVPTTLLAMVDAAVGGKTGINTGAGKNLVGSFHQPAGVLCDLDLLETLPRAELVAGLGEVVKCGFIADPEILRLVEETDPADLGRVLAGAARAGRARDPGQDRRGGRRPHARPAARGGHPGREALNYGHTLAHAIERAEDYGVRHGEAVAIGCVLRRRARPAHRLASTTRSPTGTARAFARVGPAHVLRRRRLRRRCSPRCAWTRRPAAPSCASWCSTGLARPTVLAGPDEADLRAAFDVVRCGS